MTKKYSDREIEEYIEKNPDYEERVIKKIEERFIKKIKEKGLWEILFGEEDRYYPRDM